MIEPFRRYADFSGRSRRVEFWSFILFQWLVYIGIAVAMIFGFGVLGAFSSAGGISDGAAAGAGAGFLLLVGFAAIFWLATLVPNLSVAARRMQDQDIPGWVGILLVIGGWLFSLPLLAMAVFGLLDGTRGANRFGPDPKADRAASDVFG